MRPILSIGITSYKRIRELIRCINSIQTDYVDEIEIVVSEDCSPLSKEIGVAVSQIQTVSKYDIRFLPNERNLGYDMNLGAIISKCRGEYIFFLSDDDTIYGRSLDIIIPFLMSREASQYGVFYAPFIYNGNHKKDRNRGNSDMAIPLGEQSASSYIYDSILFSGLIFRREYVRDFDASTFKNMNYFQVYLFLKMLYQYGGYYFANPSVICIGDGENAYGISESSGGNSLLANRKSVISNLEFNKSLIQVIRRFDQEEKTSVFKSFEKQYSLHSYSGLSLARRNGISYYRKYWAMLQSLEIRLYPITYLYYWTLLLLGANFTNLITSRFRKILK